MKKLISLFMVILLLILCGCSGKESALDTDTNTDTIETLNQKHDPETSENNDSVPENIKPEIPNEYRTVIDDLKTIIDFRTSKSFEVEYNNGSFPEIGGWFNYETLSNHLGYAWSCMITEMPGYPEKHILDQYGYILKDINNDSISELFFVRKDYSIIAIFTLVDGNPQLVDAFWSRYKCVITDQNEVYTFGSSGADYFNYAIKMLNSKNDFTVIKEFGAEGEYYEIFNNEREIVDKSRFDELYNKYPFENGVSWMKSFIFDFK